MTRHPRIGISFDHDVALKAPTTDYVRSVVAAGGIPVVLTSDTPWAELSTLDGLLLSGGDDCNPARYGQPLHPASELLDPRREAYDLALLAWARETQIPLLGICLGCQMINVQRGGTLIQHLPERYPDSPVLHSSYVENGTRHARYHGVTLRPGTQLMAIYDQQHLPCNSRHHQAIDQLAPGLIPTAYSEDGILEGVEDPQLPFFLGVQWHPENLAPTTPLHLRLFQAHITAAQHYHHP